MLAEKGILAGVPTREDYPQLGEAILICTTEVHQRDDLIELVRVLASAVKALRSAGGTVAPGSLGVTV